MQEPEVRLLQGTAEFFPALIAALDSAHTDVQFETYLFDFTGTGATVAEALERAAQRGLCHLPAPRKPKNRGPFHLVPAMAVAAAERMATLPVLLSSSAIQSPSAALSGRCCKVSASQPPRQSSTLT